MIYLDYAAATPVDEEVIKAMEVYWQDKFYNPSALYVASRETAKELDSYRKQVASLIGSNPAEIYFTAGATESINLSVGGVLRAHPEARVVVGAIEHSAVLASAKGFAGEDRVTTAPVNSDGLIDLAKLKKAITDDVVLVSIGYVNGEIGVIQPIKQIVELIKEVRLDRSKRGVDLPLYLHSDCSQAVEYLDIHVARLGVDMLSLNGGKIYGPKQSGVLYVRRGIELEPLIYGGGQEGGLRGGSESLAMVSGFSKALEIATGKRKAESNRLKILQQQLIKGLKSIEDVQINGSLKYRIAANVNVSFADINGETLVHHLDAKGICVATGSACVSGSGKPSHVLEALGLESELVSGSLRISMGRTTTAEEIDKFLELLAVLVPKLRDR